MEKQLQRTEKQKVASSAEQTRPGLVFTPAVDIFENDSALTVLADLPGVKAKDLKIDLRESTLFDSHGSLTLAQDCSRFKISFEAMMLLLRSVSA